jgi:hypothetical protein
MRKAKNASRNLVRKPLGKRPFMTKREMKNYNITIYLSAMNCNYRMWMQLAQERV